MTDGSDLMCAERCERTAERDAYRAIHCDRKLVATFGEVTERMPKLRGMRFTAVVIDRYRRRETSVEKAMIEMYLMGIPIRRIEGVSEALWGVSVSAATFSLMVKICEPPKRLVSRWQDMGCPSV